MGINKENIYKCMKMKVSSLQPWLSGIVEFKFKFKIIPLVASLSSVKNVNVGAKKGKGVYLK